MCNSIEIYTVPGMHVWQTNEKRKIRKEKKNDKYIIIYNRIKQNKLIIISDTNRKTKKLGKEKQIHITNLKLLKILINLN